MSILTSKGLGVMKALPVVAVAAVAMLGFAPSTAHAETIERNYVYRSYLTGNSYTSTSHHRLTIGGQPEFTFADTTINGPYNSYMDHDLDFIYTGGRKFELYVNGQKQASGNWKNTDYVVLRSWIQHFNDWPAVGAVYCNNNVQVKSIHGTPQNFYDTETSYWNVDHWIQMNTASTPAEKEQWDKDPYSNPANSSTLNIKVVFDDEGPSNATDGSSTYVRYKDSGELYNGEWTNKDLVMATSLTKTAQSVVLRRNGSQVKEASNTRKDSYDITQETAYSWRMQGDYYRYFFKYGTGTPTAYAPGYFVKIDKTKPLLGYSINGGGQLTDKSSDALAGLAKVEIAVDGSNWQTLRQADAQGNVSDGGYLFAADGQTHNFRYRVTDRAGNVVEQQGSWNSSDGGTDVKPTGPDVPGDGSGNGGDGFSAQSVR